MHFEKKHTNGTFRWSVFSDGKTVKVERACVNFFAAEYGQLAYDELTTEVPSSEFVKRSDLQDVVEQGFGTDGLDELLAALGAPASGRSPRREAAPQVCRGDECRFEEGGSGGAIAQLSFGAFLLALVPGLLAFGVWMGRRG